MRLRKALCRVAVTVLTLATPAMAQDIGHPDPEVIKGLYPGKTHEKIYDVAVSDGRTIGADGRCKTPVGNTVDVEAANWTNTIGASELATVWTDPDFDPDQKALYYARILEIPTPRWVLYDKVRLGAEIPQEAKLIHQERAYTSPIWYQP